MLLSLWVCYIKQSSSFTLTSLLILSEDEQESASACSQTSGFLVQFTSCVTLGKLLHLPADKVRVLIVQSLRGCHKDHKTAYSAWLRVNSVRCVLKMLYKLERYWEKSRGSS